MGRRVSLILAFLALGFVLLGFDGCQNKLPKASFDYAPTAPEVGERITFDGSSSFDPDGRIVAYNWDFGDSATAEGVTVTHAYAARGDYPVTLIVTDNKGATGSLTKTVTVIEEVRPQPSVAIKAPGPDPTGLTWDGAYLWNADAEEAKIYKLDPNTGQVVASFDSPGLWPEGLAWDGRYLWNADADELLICKLDPSSGKAASCFGIPGVDPTGLAWDGTYLWNADLGEEEPKIYKLNPATGRVVASFPAPGFAPTGLAFGGGYLWMADGIEPRIYKLDPADGRVVGVLVAPGPDPRDLAFDGTYLWCADGKEGKIYRIGLQ